MGGRSVTLFDLKFKVWYYLVLLFAKSNRSIIHKDRFPNGVMTIKIPLFHSCIQSIISANYVPYQPLQANIVTMVTKICVKMRNRRR